MRAFANQVLQVFENYTTRTMFWVLLTVNALTVLLQLPFSFGNGTISGLFFGAYICWAPLGFLLLQQTSWQYAHPRSKLLPRFNAAHLVLPGVIILFITILAPGFIAVVNDESAITLMAASSATYAMCCLIRQGGFVARILMVSVFLLVILSTINFLEISELKLPLTSLHGVLLIALSWIGIATYFYRLTTSREDDSAYILATQSASVTKPSNRFPNSGGQQWSLSEFFTDRWAATLRGYHDENPRRIRRLLQYGFGNPPPVVTAVGASLVMLAFSYWLAYGETTEAVVDPLVSMLWFPLLAPAFIPGAMAFSAILNRFPAIPQELMLPFTRTQLIDGIFKAAAWSSFLLWLGLSSVAVYFLVFTPGLEFRTSLVATFLVMSAAVSLLLFSAVINIMLWDSPPARIVALTIIASGLLVLFMSWCFTRENWQGDIPFLIIAILLISLARYWFRIARSTWLILEFGLAEIES